MSANDFDGIEIERCCCRGCGKVNVVDDGPLLRVRVRVSEVGRDEECRYRALATIDWAVDPVDLLALILALDPTTARRKVNRGGIVVVFVVDIVLSQDRREV